MRVGDTRCYGLGHCSSHHELEEISGGFGVGWLTWSKSHQFRFDGFVDNEMNHCLRNSEVWGSDAFVEARQTLGIKKHSSIRTRLLGREMKNIIDKKPCHILRYSAGHHPVCLPTLVEDSCHITNTIFSRCTTFSWGKWSTRRKHTSASRFPPQIPRVPQDQTQVSALRNRCRTARAWHDLIPAKCKRIIHTQQCPFCVTKASQCTVV